MISNRNVITSTFRSEGIWFVGENILAVFTDHHHVCENIETKPQTLAWFATTGVMPRPADQLRHRRMGQNEGLLAGFGRKLRLNGSASFRHTRQMLVPRQAGVYLLHDLRGVLYAGSTRNLYRRFHQHYWLTANDLIERAMRQPFGELTFSWFLVADDRKRAALERVLIGWLRPPCNRVFHINNLNEGE